MASASRWTPISEKEVKKRRKTLPKGHTREQNTAHTVGYDSVESDGDSAVITPTPMPTSMAQAAVPREVADDIFGMIFEWAKGSRETYQLIMKIMRQNDPVMFGHLSDEELATKIEQHARDAARKATETVYKTHLDQGNDLDMWSGKPVTIGKKAVG